MTRVVRLRPAGPGDLERLRRWDAAPHVLASDPHDDWQWETELARTPAWREQLIVEVDERPVGYVEIVDPARETPRYWDDAGPGLRAVDAWIGESSELGHGVGTEALAIALARCFADPGVGAVVIDPLADNERALRFWRRLGFVDVGERLFGEDLCRVHRLERAAWRAAARPEPEDGVTVVPMDAAHVDGYRACLDAVARERRHLAILEAPDRSRTEAFVRQAISDGGAMVVALAHGEVVGWCGVARHWAPACVHRGALGIGVAAAYRGRSLGLRMLDACATRATAAGIARIGLEVRADNVAAIRLYGRAGFVVEGRHRGAMRIDDTDHDTLSMALRTAWEHSA